MGFHIGIGHGLPTYTYLPMTHLSTCYLPTHPLMYDKNDENLNEKLPKVWVEALLKDYLKCLPKLGVSKNYLGNYIRPI